MIWADFDFFLQKFPLKNQNPLDDCTNVQYIDPTSKLSTVTTGNKHRSERAARSAKATSVRRLSDVRERKVK